MQVTTTINETKELIKKWKKDGKSIGLVPTMGFLHEGHASLIQKCREENDIVVVSDFVNPTQFGPNEDLEAYPRDFERDSQLCERSGADLIFCPSPEEMYHDPQRRMHRCVKTFQHRDTGSCLLRTEGCPAACDHPQDGTGSEF